MIETHILLGLSIFLFIALILVIASLLDLKQNNAKFWYWYPINDNVDELITNIVASIESKRQNNSDYRLTHTEQSKFKKDLRKILTKYFSCSHGIQIPSNTFYRFAFDQNKNINDLKQSHESEWDKLHSFAAFLSLCTDYSEDKLQVIDHKIDLSNPRFVSDQQSRNVVHKEELEEVLELLHEAEKQYVQDRKSEIIELAKNNLLTQCITTRPVDEKTNQLREIISKEKNRGTKE